MKHNIMCLSNSLRDQDLASTLISAAAVQEVKLIEVHVCSGSFVSTYASNNWKSTHDLNRLPLFREILCLHKANS